MSPHRRKIRLLQEIPLLIWLVLVWAVLWQDFSPGTLLFGALLALAVTRVFYLPPVQLSGRFNVPRAALFTLEVLSRTAWASLQVTWVALVQGPKVRNAVLRVPLRSHSDLILTAVGHVSSWIPGSMVVDVDRSTSTLYLHALNVHTPQDAAKVRADVRRIEAKLILIMGSKAEVLRLKAEKAEQAGKVQA
ncbi:MULTISPECIES: Na+/H+ antiporter subunit E [Arthrobacter]|uniref:Na+/H+ antiporter subunit E n=2 Tax=Arthrobacter TaxID=1663 RepID=A0ABU9KKX4_9MICC|nr:Na+/H+ antiporter subunit E [Arthrobacter sp. YJM1]MDP5226749.1 Na+/H+ antiporter subunit E [Arthrobacter sp. YJM1]